MYQEAKRVSALGRYSSSQEHQEIVYFQLSASPSLGFHPHAVKMSAVPPGITSAFQERMERKREKGL